MKARKKKIRIYLVVVLLFVCLITYYLCVVSPLVCKLCEEQGIAKITDIINESNDVLLSKKFFYEDFFTVKTDSDGYATIVYSNNQLINQLVFLWSTEIQNRLNSLREIYVSLPAGVYTGSSFLSQFGKKIDIKTDFICNCNIYFHSEFQSKGINLTLHSLYLTAVVDMRVLVPAASTDRQVSFDLVLTETILQGKIPQTYIGGKEGLEYLDLLD